MTSIDAENLQVRVEGRENPEGHMTLTFTKRPALTKLVDGTGSCVLTEIEFLQHDSAYISGNRSTLASGAQVRIHLQHHHA